MNFDCPCSGTIVSTGTKRDWSDAAYDPAQSFFEPTRNEAAIRKMQEQVNRYWAAIAEKTGAAR